jgi:hypothetical protein
LFISSVSLSPSSEPIYCTFGVLVISSRITQCVLDYYSISTIRISISTTLLLLCPSLSRTEIIGVHCPSLYPQHPLCLQFISTTLLPLCPSLNPQHPLYLLFISTTLLPMCPSIYPQHPLCLQFIFTTLFSLYPRLYEHPLCLQFISTTLLLLCSNLYPQHCSLCVLVYIHNTLFVYNLYHNTAPSVS